MKNRGKAAYEGYCYYSNYKSLVSGQQLPSWADLQENIRGAWNVAALEVEREIMNEMKITVRELIEKHFSDTELL